MTSQDLARPGLSGLLKLFEPRGRTWTEYWTVLESDTLRLYTNYESFQGRLKETHAIQLTPQSYCGALHRSSHSYHFKVCVASNLYRFKCASSFLRQHWLDTLTLVLRSFCRNTCFHCYEPKSLDVKEAGGGVDCTSVANDVSLEVGPNDSLGGEDSLDRRENIAKDSSGAVNIDVTEDQVTTPPLKLFASQENRSYSFSCYSKKGETQADAGLANDAESSSEREVSRASRSGHSTPIRNSFGLPLVCTVEPELGQRNSTSSLKIFDYQDDCVSTFSKSTGDDSPRPGSVNSAFVLEDTRIGPGISKRSSTQYGKGIQNKSKSFIACVSLSSGYCEIVCL